MRISTLLFLLLNLQLFLWSQSLHFSSHPALSGEHRALYIIPASIWLCWEPCFLPKGTDSQTLSCQTGLWFCALHRWDQSLHFCVFVCVHALFSCQRLPHSFHQLRCTFTHAVTHMHMQMHKCMHVCTSICFWGRWVWRSMQGCGKFIISLKAEINVFHDIKASLSTHRHMHTVSKLAENGEKSDDIWSCRYFPLYLQTYSSPEWSNKSSVTQLEPAVTAVQLIHAFYSE